jgi:hypothetical protein
VTLPLVETHTEKQHFQVIKLKGFLVTINYLVGAVFNLKVRSMRL